MTAYNLMCPKCGSTRMLIRQEDLDSDDEFFDFENTTVGCMACGHMGQVSAWHLVEASDDGIMHMTRGGDRYDGA